MKSNPRHTPDLSRRRFLIATAVGAVALAGSYPLFRFSRQRWRQRTSATHVYGAADDSEFPSGILQSVALFTGALHGSELTVDDVNELVGRLGDAARWDGGWRTEYRWTAEYADQCSSELFATDFASTDAGQREDIIRFVMTDIPSLRSRKSRIIAALSDAEMKRRKIHHSTIPHLKWLYRLSGVPWRHRGYTAWPGIPRDQLDYTRQGHNPSC
jgi:hypothetical protein